MIRLKILPYLKHFGYDLSLSIIIYILRKFADLINFVYEKR